jgi:FixJ family two-component response regulator
VSRRLHCDVWVMLPMQVLVSGTEEVLAVMARGAANRAVADTKMNERSSRSHRWTCMHPEVQAFVLQGHNLR